MFSFTKENCSIAPKRIVQLFYRELFNCSKENCSIAPKRIVRLFYRELFNCSKENCSILICGVQMNNPQSAGLPSILNFISNFYFGKIFTKTVIISRTAMLTKTVKLQKRCIYKTGPLHYTMSLIIRVLILDGNSEHVAHARRKIVLFEEKNPICDHSLI